LGRRQPGEIYQRGHARRRREWTSLVRARVVFTRQRFAVDGLHRTVHGADHKGTFCRALGIGHPASGQERPQDHRDKRDMHQSVAKSPHQPSIGPRPTVVKLDFYLCVLYRVAGKS